jgi:antitoxin component YwqK of YwqJK toxin-antitoxin module
MKRIFAIIAAVGLLTIFLPSTVRAENRIVKRDTNEDGNIDQIAHFTEDGQISKLEIDNNGDGTMDRFQYYENEEVVQVQRDEDYDGSIDVWEYFEEGRKRVASIKL